MKKSFIRLETGGKILLIMSLIDLMKGTSDINITVRLGDLMEAVGYCVNKTKKELEQQVNETNEETYPTQAEVAKMLGVHKTTLFRWQKQGYLTPIKIGGKFHYKMSDIKQILEGRK